MQNPPELTQFRIEISAQNVAHLIFDAPGRTMNVFSNAAIHELGLFVAWFKESSVKGAVISSGKPTGFCAGADLAELGVAYGMIMEAPEAARFQVAFDHFFRLSQALRALETSGKPVAIAIGGLALGGGCELALGGHYRVLADTPTALFGLPESLVGLLPGGGGTQRLPRLIGLQPALDILLAGGRLSGAAAVNAKIADELVPAGEEVAAAERWVLSNPDAAQPWDRPQFTPPPAEEITAIVGAARREILAQTLGHYPAPLAILDCLQQGLPQPMDAAIRSEMRIFAGLIQRPEARDMIGTLFLAKLDHDRLKKAGGIPAYVQQAVEDISRPWRGAEPDTAAALTAAGFEIKGISVPPADPDADRARYWFASPPFDARKEIVRAVLDKTVRSANLHSAGLTPAERRVADYILVTETGFPPYLGGPFTFSAHSETLDLVS